MLGEAIKRISTVLLCLVFIVGCTRRAEWLDQREERDPLVQRALAKKRANDIEGALKLFQESLDRKPGMARPHLELGVLYDGEQEDYIRAIYHYERYLELRPATEKKDLIRDLIRHARISFAASLPDTPSGAIEEIAVLKKENKTLKAQIAALTGQAKPRNVQTAQNTSSAKAQRPSVTPAPAPAQPAVQTYRVLTGDTLSSIAGKMYNDPGKWEKIYNANRNTLRSPSSLKVGQTLMIPR